MQRQNQEMIFIIFFVQHKKRPPESDRFFIIIHFRSPQVLAVPTRKIGL